MAILSQHDLGDMLEKAGYQQIRSPNLPPGSYAYKGPLISRMGIEYSRVYVVNPDGLVGWANSDGIGTDTLELAVKNLVGRKRFLDLLSKDKDPRLHYIIGKQGKVVESLRDQQVEQK